MNIFLLIAGIFCILAGIIALLFSGLQCHGYYHLLDGDASVYARLRRRMVLFLAIGTVLAAIGIVCVIIS